MCFGSVARKEDTIDSDINFLVSFPKGYDIFKQRMPYEILGSVNKMFNGAI